MSELESVCMYVHVRVCVCEFVCVRERELVCVCANNRHCPRPSISSYIKL